MIFENVLGAEKSQCKSLVDRSTIFEISSLVLMSAENIETLTFVFLKLCFLGFVHRHNELFLQLSVEFLSINSQVQVRIRLRVDKERNAHTLLNYNRFKAEFLFMLRCLCSEGSAL